MTTRSSDYEAIEAAVRHVSASGVTETLMLGKPAVVTVTVTKFPLDVVLNCRRWTADEGCVLHGEQCPAWVSMDDIAARAGVARSTVKQWRVRHVSFPPPIQDHGRPLWAWSDVARWIAQPRSVGRPRKSVGVGRG